MDVGSLTTDCVLLASTEIEAEGIEREREREREREPVKKNRIEVLSCD